MFRVSGTLQTWAQCDADADPLSGVLLMQSPNYHAVACKSQGNVMPELTSQGPLRIGDEEE
jgi:hypothetical protein